MRLSFPLSLKNSLNFPCGSTTERVKSSDVSPNTFSIVFLTSLAPSAIGISSSPLISLSLEVLSLYNPFLSLLTTLSAINRCKDNGDRYAWVYLEIETEEYISQEDMKLMNEYKKDIVEIMPKLVNQAEEYEHIENVSEKSMSELFKEFYMSQRGVEPKGEIMDLFLSIVQESEDEELDSEVKNSEA